MTLPLLKLEPARPDSSALLSSSTRACAAGQSAARLCEGHHLDWGCRRAPSPEHDGQGSAHWQQQSNLLFGCLQAQGLLLWSSQLTT